MLMMTLFSSIYICQRRRQWATLIRGGCGGGSGTGDGGSGIKNTMERSGGVIGSRFKEEGYMIGDLIIVLFVDIIFMILNNIFWVEREKIDQLLLFMRHVVGGFSVGFVLLGSVLMMMMRS